MIQHHESHSIYILRKTATLGSILMLLGVLGVGTARPAATDSSKGGIGSEPPALVEYWDAARRPIEDRFPDAMPMPMPSPDPSKQDNDGWVEGRLISRDLRTGEITTQAGVGIEDIIGHRYVEGGFGLQDLLERPEDVAKAFNGWSQVNDPTVGDYPKRVRIWMGFWDQNNIRRTYTCSGTLIDPKHVITAGHCVYSHDDTNNGYIFEAFSDSVVVSPAFQNNTNPFRTAQGVVLHSWTGWTQNEDFSHDVGIIDLDRPIGGLTGWWGYGFNEDCSWFEQGTWKHEGYPAEALYGFNGQTMWENGGNFDGCGGNEADFDMPSYGGSSGSGAVRNGAVYAVLSRSDRTTHTTDTQLTSTKYADTQAIIVNGTPSSLDLVAMNVTGPATGTSGSQLANLSFAAHNYSSATQNGTWSYEVYLSTNSYISQTDIYLGGGSFPANFTPKSTASIVMANPPVIPANVASGQYFLGVYLTYNDANVGNNGSHGVDAWSINVSCPGSSVPTLQAPYANATCMPLNLTFDWSDLGVGADYELQIGTSCGSGQVIAVSGSQYTYYGLQAGTDYLWRVRGKNACGGWGNWSGCRAFSTEQSVTVTPIPLSPSNGAHCESTNPTLAWAASPNLSEYQVQVGTSCGQGSTYTATDLHYQAMGLQPGLQYYWRVRAKTDCGDWTNWSYCYSLKTEPSAVTAPALIGPFDGSPCENEATSVLWMYDPEAASYDVEVGTACQAVDIAQVNITGTSVALTGLQGGVTYYWRYRMHHECGLISPWTPCYSFTVDTAAPTNPANLVSTSHQVGVCSQDNTVDLTWDHAVDSCGAVIYSIVWDESPTTIPDDTPEIEVNFDTSPPLADGNHWFHLRTFDTADNESSQVLHIGPFCIDTTAPAAPQMVWTTVDAGAPGGYPEVTFQWAAADDATSGVVGYSYDFELAVPPASPPDATVESAELSATMVQISDASWYFDVRAVDAAGNAGPVTSFGPVVVSSSRPGAAIQGPPAADVLQEGSVFLVRWLPYVPRAKTLDPVTLSYTTDGGDSYTPIAVLTEDQFLNGEFDWIVPAANTETAALRLAIPDVTGAQTYVRSVLFPIQGNPTEVADGHVPGRAVLKGNFPNPFNPQTTIQYELPDATQVSLRVHDLQGRLVRTLVDARQEGPASHSVVWNGKDDQGRPVSSGVYFYVLETPEMRQGRRMILLK